MGRFAQSRNEKHQNHHKLRKSNSTSVTTGKNRELIYPAKGHSNSGKRQKKKACSKHSRTTLSPIHGQLEIPPTPISLSKFETSLIDNAAYRRLNVQAGIQLIDEQQQKKQQVGLRSLNPVYIKIKISEKALKLNKQISCNLSTKKQSKAKNLKLINNGPKLLKIQQQAGSVRTILGLYFNRIC